MPECLAEACNLIASYRTQGCVRCVEVIVLMMWLSHCLSLALTGFLHSGQDIVIIHFIKNVLFALLSTRCGPYVCLVHHAFILSQRSVVSDNVHKVMAHKGSLLQSLYVHPALAWMSLTAQSRNNPWPCAGKRFASEASNLGMSMYQTIKSHSLLQMS